MPTSAPGNERGRQGGFTLIELMVVVALIAISTAVVSLALPDPAATRLEREAARLTALLESARSQARAGALSVVWVPQPAGPDADFQFLGLPPALMPPLKWLVPEVHARVVDGDGRSVTLGPEPVIGAQRIVLSLDDRELTLSTDGLGPFEVRSPDDAAALGRAPMQGGQRAPSY